MECIPLNKADMQRLESLQARLVKASLGLSKYLRSTPLLHAMKIKKFDTLVAIHSVKLLKSVLSSDSQSRTLYMHFIHNSFRGPTLLSRFNRVVSNNGMSFIRTLVHDEDSQALIRQLKSHPVNDGVIDSCRTLLRNYSQSDKDMLRMLLFPQH